MWRPDVVSILHGSSGGPSWVEIPVGPNPISEKKLGPLRHHIAFVGIIGAHVAPDPALAPVPDSRSPNSFPLVPRPPPLPTRPLPVVRPQPQRQPERGLPGVRCAGIRRSFIFMSTLTAPPRRRLLKTITAALSVAAVALFIFGLKGVISLSFRASTTSMWDISLGHGYLSIQTNKYPDNT